MIYCQKPVCLQIFDNPLMQGYFNHFENDELHICRPITSTDISVRRLHKNVTVEVNWSARSLPSFSTVVDRWMSAFAFTPAARSAVPLWMPSRSAASDPWSCFRLSIISIIVWFGIFTLAVISHGACPCTPQSCLVNFWKNFTIEWASSKLQVDLITCWSPTVATFPRKAAFHWAHL